MADEAKVTDEAPATEVENAPETPIEAPVSTEKPEKEPEPTVGELLNPEQPKPNLVPEAALLSEKKGRKEAERKLKELETQIKAGASKEEVSEGIADIESVLEKYGLDDANKQFFKEFVSAVKAKDREEIESLKFQLTSVTEKEKAEKFDKVFKKHYSDALETMPEFKDIANPDVIKALSLAPENANKTFAQIIEDTYGKAVPGRRTIETNTSPGGGKAPEPIDYERAKKDGAYVTEILKDPVRKAEYNKHLLETLQGR